MQDAPFTTDLNIYVLTSRDKKNSSSHQIVSKLKFAKLTTIKIMTTSFEEEKKKKLHTSTVHKHSGNMISYSIVLYNEFIYIYLRRLDWKFKYSKNMHRFLPVFAILGSPLILYPKRRRKSKLLLIHWGLVTWGLK